MSVDTQKEAERLLAVFESKDPDSTLYGIGKVLRALLTERDEAIRRMEAAEQRASTLEDAAFHPRQRSDRTGGGETC